MVKTPPTIKESQVEVAPPKSASIERLVSASPLSHDEANSLGGGSYAASSFSLRPKNFQEYPGQTRVKANLGVYVQAALQRGRPLDHVILHGPPGLGKTTLAQILAQELSAPFCPTSAPSIERPGDLAGLLSGLSPGSLLFIDEIHRLSLAVEEVLYGAMEDFSIDLMVGAGPTARSVRLDLAPFTLVGATTRLSRLSRPFLARFGIQERLDFYSSSELAEIVQRSASILGVVLDADAALAIASRSRGTPRVANRLLRRTVDFADVAQSPSINSFIVARALDHLDIDQQGLEATDRALLRILAERYAGGPVGIDTLAVTLGEERSTIEEVYEPFLVHQGFLARGPRGRSLTLKGREHLECPK